MSHPLDFPTCYVCRSVELELIRNEEFGPMTLCAECGYSWIATYEDLGSSTTETIASQLINTAFNRGGNPLHGHASISDASCCPTPRDGEAFDRDLQKFH